MNKPTPAERVNALLAATRIGTQEEFKAAIDELISDREMQRILRTMALRLPRPGATSTKKPRRTTRAEDYEEARAAYRAKKEMRQTCPAFFRWPREIQSEFASVLDNPHDDAGFAAMLSLRGRMRNGETFTERIAASQALSELTARLQETPVLEERERQRERKLIGSKLRPGEKQMLHEMFKPDRVH